MLSPHRVFAWALAVGCLAPATANAQQVNVRWKNAQRPNVPPRGFGGGRQAGPQFGAEANNFPGIPGVGLFNTPFGAPAFPAGLNSGVGGMMADGMMAGGMMNGMGGMMGGGTIGGGMMNGMGGMVVGGITGGGMMNGMGGFGINNGFASPLTGLYANGPLGSPLGGLYGNGPFGSQFNNPLSNPFNNSFNSPFANPFLSTFNSPLNGGYVGNGFNGPLMMNPAFSNPFNVFPRY